MMWQGLSNAPEFFSEKALAFDDRCYSLLPEKESILRILSKLASWYVKVLYVAN